ncbi:MAG: tetratricopeptide repeat protein [Crocinitomicaceae bacterium]
MSKNNYILFLVFVALLSACGTKKNGENPTDKVFSKADYAYIEKFHEAIRLKTKGQIDESILGFEACLAMRQNDDAVYFALSELYLMKGNEQKSGEMIQKAAKLDPKNLHYSTELAYYFAEKNQFPEAIAQFEKLVKAQPRNPEVLYPYAECLVRAGKTQEAINQLNKTQDQIGLIPDISIQKFQLYLKLKQEKKAMEELEIARVMYPEDPQLLSTLVDYYFNSKQEAKGISTLEDLAKADPENGRVHLFLADVYRQKGETEKYYPELKKAFLGQGVDDDTKTKVLLSLQSPKMDPRAMELAEIFVAENPESAKAHSILGDYYLEMEKDDEALVQYKKALEFEKNAQSLWNQVMIMEYQTQKFQELAEDSKEGLKYFPNAPSFYLLNGVGNIQTKKYDEAIAILEIGQELVVNDKPLLGEFYGQLGEAYFGKKDLKKGNESYTKAMEKDPYSTLLMNNYAFRLASEKLDLNKAEGLIKKANEKSPNQLQFLDTYGWVLFQKGDFQNAITYFEKAFAIDDEDRLVTEHLGDASIQLGKSEDALKYWKIAKMLGSTNKNLDLKMEKLKYYEPVF